MKILVLDDSLDRHRKFKETLIGHNVTHVTTVQECIESLQKQEFDVAFLDHDLNGKVFEKPGPTTGWGVAVWMKQNPNRTPKTVVIHSLNKWAGMKMMSIIPAYCVRMPFAWIESHRILDNGMDVLKYNHTGRHV